MQCCSAAFVETFVSALFFRNSSTAEMSLFKTAPRILYPFASIRSKISLVTLYLEMRGVSEMKYSHAVKLSVKRLAIKYSARHQCIKCAFPTVIYLIILNCSNLPLCRNLFA